MDTRLILDGIRVVEAATMVFVPSAAAIMSDFGAEVIKIEGPGSADPHRTGHQRHDQRHAEHTGVEADRCVHIGCHEGEVVHTLPAGCGRQVWLRGHGQ